MKKIFIVLVALYSCNKDTVEPKSIAIKNDSITIKYELKTLSTNTWIKYSDNVNGKLQEITKNVNGNWSYSFKYKVIDGQRVYNFFASAMANDKDTIDTKIWIQDTIRKSGKDSKLVDLHCFF